jgi:hypothetical protein
MARECRHPSRQGVGGDRSRVRWDCVVAGRVRGGQEGASSGPYWRSLEGGGSGEDAGEGVVDVHQAGFGAGRDERLATGEEVGDLVAARLHECFAVG